MKSFEAITVDEHSEIEEVLIKAVNDQFRKEKISENYFKYEVVLQGNKFITAMSVDEVAESAKLTVDILEELKNINNSGINRDELKRIEKQEDRYETDGDNVKTEQLLELISKLDRVRRVGGAWAMLIANPCLISAIYAVYDRIIDSFDNDDLYMQSVFFLMRAVMQMNSDECEEEKR